LLHGRVPSVKNLALEFPKRLIKMSLGGGGYERLQGILRRTFSCYAGDLASHHHAGPHHGWKEARAAFNNPPSIARRAHSFAAKASQRFRLSNKDVLKPPRRSSYS
jgi:hypothetical protein